MSFMKISICRLVHTGTLSYDMSIVDLMANISQWKKGLYKNCIRICNKFYHKIK